MRRHLAVLAAVPILAAPFLLALFSGGYFAGPRLWAGIAVWAMVIIVTFAWQFPLPWTLAGKVALGGLTLLTGWVILSVNWAPINGDGIADAQRLLLYLGFLIAAIPLLRDERVQRAAEPALLAGTTAVCLYGLSERLLPDAVSLQRVLAAGDRLALPLTYWNAMGALAAVGVALAIGVAGDARRAAWLRAAAVAAAAPTGLVLWLTFSRGALGALAVGIAVLVSLDPTPRRLRAAALVLLAAALPVAATAALPAVATQGGSATQGIAMLAVLLLSAAIGGALAWLLPGGDGPPLPGLRIAAVAAVVLAVAGTIFAAGRVEHRDPAKASAGAQRLASLSSNRYEYWQVAARSFREHPIRGVGTSGFAVAWLAERPYDESVHDAHSLYLETAAELGLIGLLALAMLYGGVVQSTRRAARREGAAVFAGTAAGLATWATHAALDWDWEMPALTLVALVLAARLIAAADNAVTPGDATAD